MGQVPHRYSLGAVRAEARQVQRGGGVEPVRRYPLRPRPGLHRHHRHRAVGQYQSRAQIPVGVRAGARLGAGYRGAGHCQSDRPDLVRRHDARASRRGRSRQPPSSRRSRKCWPSQSCARATSAARPTLWRAARRWPRRSLRPARHLCFGVGRSRIAGQQPNCARLRLRQDHCRQFPTGDTLPPTPGQTGL